MLTEKFACLFKDEQNHNMWARKIIHTIYADFLELWQVGNKLVHGATPQEKKHFQRQKVLGELQKIYKMKEKLYIQDRELFHNSPQDHMTQHKSLCQIKSWITMVKPMLQESKVCMKQLKGVGIMRTFLRKMTSKKKTKKKHKVKKKRVKKLKQSVLFQDIKGEVKTNIKPLNKDITTLSPGEIQPEIPWFLKRELTKEALKYRK